MKKKSTAKKERITRYTAAQAAKLKGKTDWKRVNKLTDKEIDAAIASDPDAAPDIETLDWTKAVAVRLERIDGRVGQVGAKISFLQWELGINIALTAAILFKLILS